MTTPPDLDAIERKVNDCALPGYFTDEQWQYFRGELYGLFAAYRAQQQQIAELEAECVELRRQMSVAWDEVRDLVNERGGPRP